MTVASVSTLLISRVSVAGEQLIGEPDFARWARLQQAVQRLDSVTVDLRLERRGRVLLVDGELRIQGMLRCERCLGGMPCDLRQDVQVGVAESEAALAAVDAERELVLAPEGKLVVQDWLEEEALLALPLLPRCTEWSSGICPVSGIEVPSLDTSQ
ncbi:YceD family protein [Acidithiobacillus sp. IBUN Pt1247-S3]|uniref:YceD family protein n=1 Tax=Acidithiobacillus sp. IBUN Pt1247-S3 TaxID=3166642 RepID=UPI0034E48373